MLDWIISKTIHVSLNWFLTWDHFLPCPIDVPFKIYRDSFYSLGGRGGLCRGDLITSYFYHLESCLSIHSLKKLNPKWFAEWMLKHTGECILYWQRKQTTDHLPLNGRQRGRGKDEWMEVENEKHWQPVGLHQNRILPSAPRFSLTPTTSHP